MELRIAEFDFSHDAPTAASSLHARSVTRHSFAPARFVFVTYAVEIEGDVQLIAFPEAVDD